MTDQNKNLNEVVDHFQSGSEDFVTIGNTSLKSDGGENGIQSMIAGIIHLLFQNKKLILLFTSAVTIGAVIISLLLPETFTSTAVLLPEADRSKLSGFAGLSDLANIAGVSMGDAFSVKLYPSIMKSEAVLNPVIFHKYYSAKFNDSLDLIHYWKIQGKTKEVQYENALKMLREYLDVSIDLKTSIVTLTLEADEPQVTSDIINNVTAELDNFMRTKRTTNATKQRQWIETRLNEVKQDLSNSENRIKDFRERNRSVAGSPLLMLEQDRLARDVQINATLFMELKKQYEMIKIEEIKNTPIVNVMDAANPAAKRTKPKRTIIVLASFILGLIGSSGYVYVKNEYSNAFWKFIAQIK